MDIGNILMYALGGVFINSFAIFCWHKLLNEKINYKNPKIYISLVVMTILGTMINFVVPQYLKIIFMFGLYFIINYLFFCRSLGKSILSTIILELILMVCEMVVVLLTSLFIGDTINDIKDYPVTLLVINLIISFLSFLSVISTVPEKIYNGLMSTFNNMRRNNLIAYFVTTIILASLFMVMSWMQLPTSILLFVNTVLVVIYGAIMVKLVNAQTKFNKINSKYETSLSSLKEYEDMMNRYRIDNHENKNQLLTIRNMIKSKDKTVPEYIDKLVDNKIKDNENIFYKTSKIPEGGLRATIYSKLCKIKELNIDYILDIANDVRTVDLINMGDDTTLNVCKVIGVFLDNAIEAVENLENKEIIIELFVMDECLCINVSNNYEGDLALGKIENARFTTKGNGHGYGLTLVNEILKEDNRLSNEKSVSREKFCQTLKIRM